jgi:hypothetical protein
MSWSSRWRIMTLAELWSMRSISMRLDVVMMTGPRMLPHRDRQAADVVEVAVGDDDQVEVLAPQGGVVRGRPPPHLLRVQPESTRMLRSPSWMNSELAPMPPSRFRSMSFIFGDIKGRDSHCSSAEGRARK